jgi:polysaccharide export outer membrane protein
MGGAQGQSRYCTPSDYGDPTADCIPLSRGQSAYDFSDGSSPLDPTALSSPYEFDGSQPLPAYTRSRDSWMNPNSEAVPRNAGPAFREKEQPTEFQRYVADSAGQLLQIFGASLFERVPATFAPLDQLPVGPDYLIAPGDELQVSIWGQFTFSRRLIVNRAGEVTLPDAGPIAVSGMTYSDAASVFKAALSHYYKNFDLNVALGRLHPIQVFVVGEARRPGSYNVSSFSTLVNAIFASGGPSARGSMRNIQLMRHGKCVHEFDLYDLLTQGDKSGDAQLSPGDTIFIPPAGPRVAVIGSVEHPAIYELKSTTTIGEVLRLADGLSPLASRKQVLLERIAEGSALRALRIPMTTEGLKTELKNGDIVRLTPVVRRFEQTVAIRGNIADSGRFPWHEEMRLSELIPSKESLLTRDYWMARNGLSSDVTASAVQDQQVAMRQPAAGPTEMPDPSPNSLQPKESAFVSSSHPAQVFFREQSRNVQGDASLGAATQVDGSPVRSFAPRNLVQQLAPDIDWEYAIVERIDPSTLSTRVLPFNLGGLVLRGDKTQDLLLEPGDVVTIFSTADFSVPQAQQLKQVTIEGEVAMAGVYTVAPGETLRQVVARAGGLTHSAYLYGAQFTRESTRREQQKRYEDFLNRFDQEVSQAASNLSSRVTSPQEAATAQTSLGSQRDLLDRLRKVSMNGRIVLDMAPNSIGEAALPDLPLENGDRLYVPSRPATVNVMGTVFEQTSFLYEEDLRTGDYLKKAGGPARSADRAHAFVIRADGSVVSRSTGNNILFARSFENLTMHPGDTLVIPLQINRPTFIRSLIDWSQVFSNFALGAAAVNILH